MASEVTVEPDLVGRKGWVTVFEQLNDDHAVRDSVQKAHYKYTYYQPPKILVVGFSDTVVQIPAVVIKACCASVALSTMLRPCKHV